MNEREQIIKHANELDNCLLEIANGRLKANKIPLEPICKLIAYARASQPAQDKAFIDQITYGSSAMFGDKHIPISEVLAQPAQESYVLKESAYFVSPDGTVQSYEEGAKFYTSPQAQPAQEPVAKIAIDNSRLNDRIKVLEDLLSSAYNIANRSGADTHWERFAGQLHVNGISPITPKTFKILPSDDYTPPSEAARIAELALENSNLKTELHKTNETLFLKAKSLSWWQNQFSTMNGVETMLVKEKITELEAKLAECEKDAERYRMIRRFTKGKQFDGGQQTFDYPHFQPLSNIFKGSVAGHLDSAIDQAIADKG